MIKIPLGSFLSAASTPIVKKVLTSLGLGIISYAGIATALNAAISSTQSAYGGLPTYVAALAGLGGIGEALGIITGAMVFRVSYTSLSKIGVLPK